ncbi:MAG: putative baseplate assembly protein, partial [Bacteroidota bacterium]
MQDTNTCGCCDGTQFETPIKIENRPGLKAISYRIGSYREFKESLLARLSSSHKKALSKLTTRSSDDFTVALLDAWAMTADVLTFYQERIANESYLNTANEQLSIIELARLVGYELRPGVAASTYLAFTIEEPLAINGQAMIAGVATGDSVPSLIKIDKGVKVQSVPAQDEKPQTYETIENIEAKAEWNAMKLRQSELQDNITKETEVLFIEGIDNRLSKNDLLLINPESNEHFKFIQKVIIHEDENTTEVRFSAQAEFTGSQLIELRASQQYANILDFNRFEKIDTDIVDFFSERLIKGNELKVLLKNKKWEVNRWKNTFNPKNKKGKNRESEVFVFRVKAAPFGYNAPQEATYHKDKAPTFAEWGLATKDSGSDIYLDSEYDAIDSDSYIAISKSTDLTKYDIDSVSFVPRTNYNISAKTTKLKLKTDSDILGSMANLRSSTVYAQSEEIELADKPLSTTLAKGNVEIDLAEIYPDLEIGKVILISGENAENLGVYDNEIRVIEDIIHNGIYCHTRLILNAPLSNSYIRKTVTINANVALATHGETVSEVLGSGNARLPFQKFILKHTPLTYTTASTSSGTASTLEIRVNDILWKEVDSLYAKKANERIYITHQDEQGQTTVIFGDGITGARLPTGQQNIKAIYRKGIGEGGMLKANQLSQLMTRPLGVKGVNNPLASSGAQNREYLSEARSNANLSIFTLDRIVSLKDYEDFARAFAGITKARAIWAWEGRNQNVHLTIAGVNGATISKDDKLYENLLTAIYTSSIEGVSIIVDSYFDKLFRVKAKISVHTDYDREKVLASVYQILKETYSFNNRDLGQAVFLSEISSIIHHVEGVIAVDIDELFVEGED